jgi:hypothetical protein
MLKKKTNLATISIGIAAGMLSMSPLLAQNTEPGAMTAPEPAVESAAVTASPEPAAVVKPANTKHDEKLQITGRIQARIMSGQRDTFWSTGSGDYNIADVNFRRLRMGAVYQLDKHWGMVVDMRLENAVNRSYITTKTGTCGGTTCVTEVKLNDSRGMLQEANLSYHHPFMGLGVALGLVRMPFNREYFTTSANLIIIERAMATSAVHQWDNGLRVDLHPLSMILGEKYKYYLSIHGMVSTGHGGAGDGGFGRRYDMTQTQGSSSTGVSPLFTGRIEYNIFGGLEHGGKASAWKEGEEIFQRDLKISLGAGFAGTNESKSGEKMSTEYTPTSTSIPLTTGGGKSLFAQTYDVTATYKGLYFNAAYQFYGGESGNNVTGYDFTAGYNMPIYGNAFLMPAVRYDFMKGNFAAPKSGQVSSDPANQFSMVWVGVNLFHSHHNLKLQLFYNIFTNNYKGYDASGTALGGYAQNVLIFQAQVNFKTGVGG